jgi:hypothetical protein
MSRRQFRVLTSYLQTMRRQDNLKSTRPEIIRAFLQGNREHSPPPQLLGHGRHGIQPNSSA